MGSTRLSITSKKDDAYHIQAGLVALYFDVTSLTDLGKNNGYVNTAGYQDAQKSLSIRSIEAQN